MHEVSTAFARAYLIEGLKVLSPGNKHIFCMLYGRDDGRRSVEDADALTIEEVVKMVPKNKLANAMDQLHRTLVKLE